MLFFGGLLKNNNSNFQNAYVQIIKVPFFWNCMSLYIIAKFYEFLIF